MSETIALDERRGGVREDAQGRGAALGGGLLMASGSTIWSRPARSLSTAARGTSTTTCGSSATTARWSSSTPRTTPTRSPPPSADRRVVAIVCTHGHDDHIDAAPALADRFGAPILLNPADAPLWDMKWPDRMPDGEIPAASSPRAAITLRVAGDTRATPPARSASTRPTSARSSPATPCSTAARAPPAGRSRPSPRSSTRSGRRCSRCRRTRPCAPGTATRRRSAPRPRTWRSGSRGAARPRAA